MLFFWKRLYICYLFLVSKLKLNFFHFTFFCKTYFHIYFRKVKFFEKKIEAFLNFLEIIFYQFWPFEKFNFYRITQNYHMLEQFLATRECLITSFAPNFVNLMDLTSFRTSIECFSPEIVLFGRSIWLKSPLTTAFDPNPILLRTFSSAQ